MNWYDSIEEEVRPLVKLLRDNGFNTTSSCGHKMLVESDVTLDGEMKRLHDLLFNSGYQNYELTFNLVVHNQHIVASQLTVNLKPKYANLRRREGK